MVPEFDPVYKDHLDDHYGEVYSEVLLGDFVRFLFDAYRKSTSLLTEAAQWKDVVIRSLDLMERAVESDEFMLRNLIGGSFIENLLPSHEEDVEVYQGVKLLLRPKLHDWLMLFDPFH